MQKQAEGKALFNRIRFIFDAKLTVSNLVDKAAAALPDKPLFYTDEAFEYPGLECPITPQGLQRFTNRMANVLKAWAGLNRYDRVTIYKSNSSDYFFWGVAIMRAGGIAVPVNGGMAVDGLGHYLEYTSSRLLITDIASYQKLKNENATLHSIVRILITDGNIEDDARCINLLQALQESPEQFEAVQLANDDDVLIVHTSGTTGFPKGVIHTSGTLAAGIKGQLKIEPIFGKDIGLSAAPFNHFISYLGMLSALAAGVPTWMISDPDPDKILKRVDAEKISIVFCFPHTFIGMYEIGLEAYDLSSVRLWIAGADSSHEAHIKAFTQKGAFLKLFGKPLIRSIYADTLGSSEVGFAALFRFVFSFSKHFSRYVGRPTFAGPKVKIADAQGYALPAGTIGRLMVKGPTLFKGYWNAHDKLHGVVIDGWWWTGDVGYRDRFGRYYHYDRAVDVIRTQGGEVHTLPIEEILLNYPGVAEAVVVGRETQDGKQVPIAMVQSLPKVILDAKLIQYEINQHLKVHEQLVELHIVPKQEIPRGLTGKVLKRVLRDKFALRATGA